ncbi:penicillin-binding transpeptidase domain-containing protein [Cellulomonas sp. PhB150]|uniref:penicillin-binding transpeptidase domain-containing protein n=1 Tax=Cellulomonas sp. PhB150 TaxID=2485188 RepID=UPI000F4A237E|nr:penicillin-binding transpeptidase domain-containing protein [Cellulomonas sp. PhB150]ROS23904.1 cell division protein FtsI/penicillin-binding protein 2 [Cellulomonas sp. PhB150]
MVSARRFWVTAGVVASLVGLTACTSDPPGPEAAAKTLGQALGTGDFSDVAFTAPSSTAQATTQRGSAFEALGDRKPQVVLASVTVDPDDDAKATATYGYTWDVDSSDEDWTYEVTADLTRADDDWQAAWDPDLLAPDLAADETIDVARVRAPRAEVLGADDEVIVTDRDVWRIGVDKTRVDPADQGKAARALAKALDLDAAAYAKQVAAAGPKAFVEAIVVREDDPDYDVKALGKLDGVDPIRDTLPLAPTRSFARPILGTVGPATAEVVENSKGAIAAGDLTGLSGLERQYDAQLRGLPGLTINAVSADGVTERQLYKTDATPGKPLRTTLDVELQQSAENVLAQVEPASALVAIRPSTGEVLAAASGPGGKGMSTATLGQYAPGSTFKVATTLALLRSGLTPDSPVTCAKSEVVDGRTFNNFPDYPAQHQGAIDLRTAFANSCNTAFISQRDTASQDALIDAAGSLGLVPGATLGFASFLGAVPADSDGTDHAATMIGQGRVLASPLGMATVAASVAHGSTVTPQLVVPESAAATPTPTASAEPSPTESTRPLLPLTRDEATTLHSLMRSVVTDGGATFLQDVPGDEVAAKTGTAQFGPTDDLRNHVWMIATQGDLAVAVFVDEGVYGSTTAGPLLEQFLRAAAK